MLIADQESVALNVANVTVDVDHFFAEGARGLDLSVRAAGRTDWPCCVSPRPASTAMSSRQPYADWALPLREEALALYLSIAGVLAEADTATRPRSAARRYLRMTERDPYSEHAYLGAVSAFRAAGHHGSAQRLYATYVAKMADIDVEPATFPA